MSVKEVANCEVKLTTPALIDRDYNTMLRRFFTSEITFLGRWGRLGRTQSNWKVDMANTDNCGSCAVHALKYFPKEIQTQLKQKEIIDPVEFYSVMGEMRNIPTAPVVKLQ